MANIKSQIKRNRQNDRAKERNRAVRSEVRTRIKAAETAIEEGADNAQEVVASAIKRIDVAAQKRVLHRNTAARAKSRLMHKLHAAS
ncbi:MAG: 30S ribosomal protein S20 [Actinomycetia bacterium]|nr:30S ribosomal protein S20 [Actinomycetes bacterium]